MRQCQAPLLFFVLLVLAILVPGPAHLPAGQETAKTTTAPAPNTPADLIKAEAEKTKAEAEKMKAQAEFEKIKVELKKIELDRKKAADARTQFYLQFSTGIALLVWLIWKVSPRLLKIGLPGGVQVELSQDLHIARDAFGHIGRISAERDLNDIYSPDSPNPIQKLTGPGKYQYERLSDKLYWLFDTIKDPTQLDPKTRDEYRRLIKDICRAAIAIGHYSKALDVIVHLQLFTDRELDDEELLMIGNAYVFAPLDLGDVKSHEHERKDLLGKAVRFLEDAYRTAKGPRLKVYAAYNLGWALLSLERFQEGIKWMETCIDLDQRMTPWAKWNIACGQAKLGKRDEALLTLTSIPPGPWWSYICKDEDFSELKNDPTFGDRFATLCARNVNLRVEEDRAV